MGGVTVTVEMKELEAACIKYAEKYKNNWEFYCLVKDAWLAGYKLARDQAWNVLSDMTTNSYDNAEQAILEAGSEIWSLGERKTSVEIDNPQIGQKSC